MDKLSELRKSGKIKLEVISGSHAYGTNNANSDRDTRGIFLPSINEYASMREIEPQVNDAKNDEIFYSLKRFLDLISVANPNIIELLWIPDDCIIQKAPCLNPLFEKRSIFITKQAYNSHSKYANSQIKKAKGCNKRVHNPQPVERPDREDFCLLVPSEKINGYFMGRPIPIKNIGLNLKNYHVAKMEHSANAYRIYDYSDNPNCKGVFKNGEIVCQSIPMDDEDLRYKGILIFNKENYEKSVSEWHNYWNWVKNRNEYRWIDQEKGNLNYDAKNMMHCYRLLLSSKNIIVNGEPIVRFSGKMLDFLMDIRNGNLSYDFILESSNELMSEIEELYSKSDLPEKVEVNDIDNIFGEIYENYSKDFII